MRAKLLKLGYSNWNKKDFFNFIRMCEKFGRYNFTYFVEALPYKTVDEIRDYSKAFWKNSHLIENGSKYVERIEKGEAEIDKRN
mmetsp:Transcript_28417/g.20528  ORF Transcript_28417/g.20528 Transcript_28417/m.20528 type:complete len:84 (+) Transcript_28417:170-421(+)